VAKQVYKIENFHGGLNTNADPRDIQDNELADITDLMVDDVGKLRLIGSLSAVYQTLDNTKASGGSFTEVPGAGFFQFDHDRTGAEDAGDSEAETGDNYLALYDDTDVGVWIYSKTEGDWDDDKDASTYAPINFKGKATSSAARPSFLSIDGALRISTGEFGIYDSGSDTNEVVDADELDITTTSGDNFTAGNYIQIDDEILYVTGVNTSTEVITTYRAMLGTKAVSHASGANIYIINMNQWYGYLNNRFFQTSSGVPEYVTDKWYNEVQHLRSLDELGIDISLHDASSASPTTLDAYDLVVAYWKGKDGFWSGSYFLGVTPVYLGDQEGPLTKIGSDPIQLNDQILNVQLYVGHHDIDNSTISLHPLKDDRIIGLNLYTKSFTSDEWYLLQKFDFLQGGEHGWMEYDGDADSAKGFWKTTSTADALALAAPSDTASYDGAAEDNTCTATLTLNESKGDNRVGILRLTGFEVSPLYKNVSLSSTSAQAKAFDVVNPAAGTHKFAVELLDENYNIMKRVEIEQAISESGISAPDLDSTGGYGSDGGGSS
jgi:hypothetical protein